MKRFLLLFLSLIFSFHLFGKEITIEQARQFAENYLRTSSNPLLKSTSNLKLTDAGDIFNRIFNNASTLKSTAANANRDIYIFNIGDDNGFIMISGDDAAIPVLAYSHSGKIDTDKSPQNVLKWLEGYRQQISYIKTNAIQQTEVIKSQWEGTAYTLKSTEGTSAVTPLLSTKWNQAPHVNDMCPYDNTYQELTVTGCPATAMAQIMKYWGYPNKGIGFHTYQHDKYGSLSANFGNTTYNWAAMPNEVNSANEAVATLMYHCGVAVEMNYNVASEGGSGSYVVKDPYTRYSDNQTCQNAFVQFFGYSPTIEGLFRESYTDEVWISKLKQELDAGRPIQYAGYGQGGHTFVCDGYDDNDYFHMNWGWGGYYDGYFLIDALNPGEGGIGSGAGTYNDGQQALIGIKPAQEQEEGGNTTEEYGLTLYGDVVADYYTIGYGEGFTISTYIINDGTTNFTGDVCAAIFDESNTFIDFVQTYEGVTLESGYYYESIFTSQGSLDMLPGNYNIYIFSKTGNGDWSIISESYGSNTYTYAVQMSVENNQDIALLNPIVINTENIISNDPLEITVDVVNWGFDDFNGIVDINLFNLNGEHELTIDQASTSIASGYYDTYNFYTSSLNISPGTYLLAVFHQPTYGDFILTGSTSGAPNPIKIIVQAAPYAEDSYEMNDDVDHSYALIPTFTDNTSNITTTNTNFHVGSDWDFFSINLEDGYNYDIDIRLHDAYNSGDGNTYTVDALFLYSFDGENWTGTYDDIMPSPISTAGNTTLYCVTSPYFLGETGTYLLDINIDRSSTTAIETSKVANEISISPNPCSNYIEVLGTVNIDMYSIYDITGKLQLESNVVNNYIDVSSLSKGIYFINIKTSNKNYIRKFIKE